MKRILVAAPWRDRAGWQLSGMGASHVVMKISAALARMLGHLGNLLARQQTRPGQRRFELEQGSRERGSGL